MIDDHFSDFDENRTSRPVSRNNREVYSDKVITKYRIFYIDVKENDSGRYLKISEKSKNGKRSTIMIDGKDVQNLVNAVNNTLSHIDTENDASNNKYSEDVFSEKIITELRIFYIDVKENDSGRYLKISEKSKNGKRSTIMIDKEEVNDFHVALEKTLINF